MEALVCVLGIIAVLHFVTLLAIGHEIKGIKKELKNKQKERDND